VLDRLGEIRKSDEDDPSFGREISQRKVSRRIRGDVEESPEGLPARSPDVLQNSPLFPPPFLGSRVAKGMSIDDISEYLNLTALFRNQWGFRPENGEDDPAFKVRVGATLREQIAIPII
jgi:5-methyltetrahydrofolate--homocysteine methyltransferase